MSKLYGFGVVLLDVVLLDGGREVEPERGARSRDGEVVEVVEVMVPRYFVKASWRWRWAGTRSLSKPVGDCSGLISGGVYREGVYEVGGKRDYGICEADGR